MAVVTSLLLNLQSRVILLSLIVTTPKSELHARSTEIIGRLDRTGVTVTDRLGLRVDSQLRRLGPLAAPRGARRTRIKPAAPPHSMHHQDSDGVGHQRIRVLREDSPPEGWKSAYARDGFYVIADALTDSARAAITREVMGDPRTADLLQRRALGGTGVQQQMTVRPWDTMCNCPGQTVQDGLLDAPLIQGMLKHAMGGPFYSFCHAGFSIRCPGDSGSPVHQVRQTSLPPRALQLHF
eukprot:SAG31_NODE_1037_length_10221_cov_4.564019_5_plen_238_part_00